MYDVNELYFPDASAFELLKKFFPATGSPTIKEVCITSFVDVELGFLIDLEESCYNYKALPMQGGLLDQPTLLMEVFNTIRSEKNKYEVIKFENTKNQMDQHTSVDTRPKIPRR